MVLKQKRITEAYAEVKAQPAKRKILVDENTEEKEGEEFLSIVKAGTTETGDSEADAFYLAKKALHTSKPSKLPRREAQVEEVYNFLSQHLAEKRGGSLYISGAPGTGKTAVVQHVLGLLSCGEKGCPFIHGFVNCMNLTNPTFVFEHVCNQLKVAKAADLDPKERLLKRITSKTARMM
jgi:cell division control protein 6